MPAKHIDSIPIVSRAIIVSGSTGCGKTALIKYDVKLN